MKVVVDLDPRTVWRIQTIAERTGKTLGEVVREELEKRAPEPLSLHQRIRARVLAGLTDAQIAHELHMTNLAVADIRRGERLPANRRNERKAS